MAALTRKARSPGAPVETDDPKLSRRTSSVKGWLDAQPGAVAAPFSARRGSPPIAVIYKVMGKIFAILSIRGVENVILKCDPHLATMLRAQYTGVGHRSHLDRRYWISVTLDADVPTTEIKRLVSQSYDLVCSQLTVKQKVELSVLTSRRDGT
jgi:predicted DNA-binding protein (MmcQ/YjbR family)